MTRNKDSINQNEEIRRAELAPGDSVTHRRKPTEPGQR